MFKIVVAAGLMLTPAIALAQLGAGIGTEAYAHGHSHEGDKLSGAGDTPMHKSHVEHYRAQQADAGAAANRSTADAKPACRC